MTDPDTTTAAELAPMLLPPRYPSTTATFVADRHAGWAGNTDPAGGLLWRTDPDSTTGYTDPMPELPPGNYGPGTLVRVTVELIHDEPAPLSRSWARDAARQVMNSVLRRWYGDEGWTRPNRWPHWTGAQRATFLAACHRELDDQLDRTAATDDDRAALHVALGAFLLAQEATAMEQWQQRPGRYPRPERMDPPDDETPAPLATAPRGQ